MNNHNKSKMQQSNEESYPSQTDEIDLRKAFNTLTERKLFIFSFTGFITLLAILYSLNTSPIYKTTSTFTSPNNASIVNLNKLKVINTSKESVFGNFLTHLSSREMQIKVFRDGGYLNEFNLGNYPDDDYDPFVLNYIKSVKISPPKLTEKNKVYLTEKPYSVSMEGTNPELITRYLNELVVVANTISVNEFIADTKQMIAIRLDEISLQTKLLLKKAKQERLNLIEVLSDAAKIAKSLGIVDNNFIEFKEEVLTKNLIIAIGENQRVPVWYLHGEKALLERVNTLKNRKNDRPFIPELVALEIQKMELESLIIDLVDIDAMQISQIARLPLNPISPNKIMIVLISFISGFMMSILLALFMNALKPYDKQTN